MLGSNKSTPSMTITTPLKPNGEAEAFDVMERAQMGRLGEFGGGVDVVHIEHTDHAGFGIGIMKA